MKNTMSQERLEKILQTTEVSTCDFKWEIYHMNEEQGRVSFLKDILSMANTIREDSAFIIIGVKQENGKNYFKNVDTTVDENQFLNFLEAYVAPDKIQFSYYQFSYKKYRLGIFEIGISKAGPYYSTRSFGEKMDKEVIYYRYGSHNAIADDRIKAEISAWMSGIPNDSYNLILEYADYFNVDQYNYVLILGADGTLNANHYDLLSQVSWSAVIDMRKCSESSGAFKYVQEKFKERLSVHLLMVDNSSYIPFYEGKSLFWLMAGGEKNQDDTFFSVRTWLRKYSHWIDSILRKVTNTCHKPIIYISILLPDDKWKQSLGFLIDSRAANPLFQKYIDFKWMADFSVEEQEGYIEFSGTLMGLFHVFRQIPKFQENNMTHSLPSKTGGYREISSSSWIQEELDPMYGGLEGRGRSVEEGEPKTFFQGRELGWDEMNPCIAIRRDKYEALKATIKTYLEQDGFMAKTISLDYMPGAGATTVLRMIGWDYHEIYPVIWIRKYSSTTVDRLASIYEDVKKMSMLIMIDTSSIDEAYVTNIKYDLLNRQIQALIVFSKRQLYGSNKGIAPKLEFFLSEQLSRNENKAFYETYSRQVDIQNLDSVEKQRRKEALVQLFQSKSLGRSPFLYALTAYEKNFVKLEDYVSLHLQDMSEEQEKIFRLIAVVQFYTGYAVPRFAFVQNGILSTGRLSLENTLLSNQKALLTFSKESVKTVHHCVAEAILKYLCGKCLMNKDAWKNELEPILLDTVDVLKINIEHETIQEIIQKLFLRQANSSSRDTHFADAIEDLPNKKTKQIFLNKLKEVFPENAYVYSNTARFYHYEMHNEEVALLEINRAISLLEDYTFYHIKGLILARMFVYYIENNHEEICEHYNEFLKRLHEERQRVFEAYDQSISLNPNNTYSYTAKIVFCLDVMRKFLRAYTRKSISDMLGDEHYAWYAGMIDDANDIIDSMKVLQEYADVEFEHDIASYEMQLSELRGDSSRAIEGWNNLLYKNDVYRPPICRALVTCYEGLCGGMWDKLEIKKQRHVQELLEKNIDEERDNSKNVLQWFRFARCFPGNLRKAVKYFALDSMRRELQYYYYGMAVFYTHAIVAADTVSMEMAQKYEKKCENLARDIPYRRKAREFYDSKKNDILSIVSERSIRKENDLLDDALKRIGTVSGRIISIEKPEVGWIQIDNMGGRVKFNPSWDKDRQYIKGRDENCGVEFVLGFRYEGAYAYRVKDLK